MNPKRKVGRPRKSEDEKQRFVKMDVYPETKEAIKKQAVLHGLTICNYVQFMVEQASRGGIK